MTRNTPYRRIRNRSRGPSARVFIGFLLWFIGLWVFVYSSEAATLQRIIAIQSITALYCIALVVTRQTRQSLWITLLVTAAVWAVSKVKMAYLGAPFVFGDLVNMIGYNLRWVLAQYPELAVTGGVGTVAFLATMIWASTRRGRRASLVTVCAAGTLVVILAGPIDYFSRRLHFWDHDLDETAAGVGTFAASVVWWWGSGGNTVTLYDVAGEPLDEPLASDKTKSHGPKPNIFMVLNESVFDPRVLGLPVEGRVADYLQPSEGLSGLLSVNVHGGATWVSEFAVMSGVDTRMFGDKAFYLPVLMEKRVHHSLVHALRRQGYRTMIVYCVNGSFMNAENFYRSLGVQEFHVPVQAAARKRLAQFSDRELFEHALERMSSAGGVQGDGPIFMMVVTISNHGPHNRKRVPEDAFPGSRSWLTQNLPDAELEGYEEYYLRLMQSVADHEYLKDELAMRFKERPTLLVRFGDHHPKFTKDLQIPGQADQKRALLTTYFAVESINGVLAARPDWGGGPLDIAYLSTLVMETAGLPKDQIFETRRQLMTSCRGRYFECEDARRARLHRTLLDRGYLQVDRVEVAKMNSDPDFH